MLAAEVLFKSTDLRRVACDSKDEVDLIDAVSKALTEGEGDLPSPLQCRCGTGAT